MEYRKIKGELLEMKAYIKNQIISRINKHLTNPMFPTQIYLGINSKCNAKCSFCDIGNKANTEFSRMCRGKGNMSKETFIRFAYQLKDKGITFNFKMTEPLLNPNLESFLIDCNWYNIDTSITTNGILLKKQARMIVEKQVKGLQVSMDFNGIDEVNKWKILYQSNHPKIQLRIVINKNNYWKIKKELDKLKKYEVHSVVIAHLDFTEDNKKYLRPDKIDARKLYRQIQLIKNETYPFKVKLFPELSLGEMEDYYETYEMMFERCAAKYKSLSVLPNGDVVPHIRCMNIVMGNINKENVKDIWKNEKYKSFRKMELFRLCRRCCQMMIK